MKLKNPLATKLIVSLVAVATSINVSAAAETLGAIVVSTTSFGQQETIEDVQATVEVLDQKSIQSLSGRSVSQVLNEAAGLTIKDAGSTANVHMRGFYDGHTLILIDGLRRTGKYGNSDLNGIALEDVERIEIVRGPMSALYGADALAGVVNIITKKAVKEDSARITIIGGQAQNQDRETGIMRASVNLAGETVSHTFAVEARERGDYRRNQAATATDLREESKTFFSYGNNAKFENDTLQTRFEFWDQDDSGVHSSGAATHEKEKRYQFSGIYSHVNDNYLLDTNLGYGYSDTDVDRGSGSETTEYSQLEFNSYLRHFTTDNVTNIFGIGAKREDIEVSMYTQEAERTNYSALYQNEWDITENLSTIVGLRFDDYSDFGSATNPRLSVKYVHGNTNFRVGYGEAFKAPSFTNMYSSFTRGSIPLFNITGNPNLAPEESETYELAVGHKGESYRLDLIYHYTDLDNLISSYTASGAFPVFNVTYDNIDKASISGTELIFTVNPAEGLTIKGSLEYLDTEDKTTGLRLTNSAQFTGKLHVAYVRNAMSYYLNVKTWDDYYAADATRTNVNSDYTVADVKVSYAYDKKVEFFGGIENIENKEMPFNMQLFGSPNDPGERYFYIGSTINF
jgi:outer membrane receptor for ferrienterochelin and colicins